MKNFIKFIKLPLKIKLVFIEAYILLGFSRLILWKLSFKTIAGLLGRKNQETEVSNEGIDLAKVKQVSVAVTTISKYTPWKSKCLVQAYAAKLMLNRRKLKSTVYLGVAKDKHGNMIAHAWIRCGRIYVTGGDGSLNYTVTGKFG